MPCELPADDGASGSQTTLSSECLDPRLLASQSGDSGLQEELVRQHLGQFGGGWRAGNQVFRGEIGEI